LAELFWVGHDAAKLWRLHHLADLWAHATEHWILLDHHVDELWVLKGFVKGGGELRVLHHPDHLLGVWRGAHTAIGSEHVLVR
jgi:hypothetical protein